MKHISDFIVATLAGDEVKRYNIYAVQGIDADLRVLEAFADEQYRLSGLEHLPGSASLKACFAEARQLTNLLLGNQPELYLDQVGV
jgi:hypothetical protein